MSSVSVQAELHGHPTSLVACVNTGDFDSPRGSTYIANIRPCALVRDMGKITNQERNEVSHPRCHQGLSSR